MSRLIIVTLDKFWDGDRWSDQPLVFDGLCDLPFSLPHPQGQGKISLVEFPSRYVDLTNIDGGPVAIVEESDRWLD